MKHFLHFLLTGAVALTSTLTARGFIVEDLEYKILSESDLTCEVANVASVTSGDIEIPSVVIYNGLKYNVVAIGDYAFNYNHYYNGVTWVNSWLTSVTIPESVTSIGTGAFYYCQSLSYVEIPNSVTTIGQSAFCGCKNLVSIEIPHSVTTIGERAFQACTALTSIDLPTNLEVISAWMFLNCSNLASIELPRNITSIGAEAFSNCQNLTSIEIPNSVTHIYRDAFNGCKALNSIHMGDGITYIGDNAFKSCENLTSPIVLPYVEFVGEGAFRYCYDIPSISVGDNLTTIGNEAFYNCNGLTSFVIPNSVTSAGDGIFLYCHNLLTVTIGNGVKRIGKSAFTGCDQLLSVSIGNDVTSIGAYAFKGCEQLRSVIIGSSVQEVGSQAFSGCNNLYKLTMLCAKEPSGIYSSSLPSRSDRITYVPNTSYSGDIYGTIWKLDNLSSYFDVDGVRYVPVSPAEKTCVVIDCTYSPDIHDIVIGETVNFKGMAMNVTEACYNIFRGNPYIETVFVSAPMELGNNFASECPNMKTLAIENGGSLGDYAFNGCTGLTNVTLNTTGALGKYAFNGCTALQTATINNVGNIGLSCFNGCSALKYVSLGEGTNKIGDYSFAGCSELETIWIGKKVKNIGKSAFSGCRMVSKIYAQPTTAPVCSASALDDIDKWNCTVYVNTKARNSYASTAPWKNFILLEPYVFEEIHTLTYVIDGVPVYTEELETGTEIKPFDTPEKEGYTFSGWSEIPTTMPAQDVIITGSFTINQYTVTYVIDEEVILSQDVTYGTALTPLAAPAKEGYTFSGWSEMPETMPAQDIIITGSFTINQYTVTYVATEGSKSTTRVTYGEPVTLPELADAGWSWKMLEGDMLVDVPETMPARDITLVVDIPDGILNIHTNESENLYTLSGVKVNHGTQRGIYIRNGKKVLIK